jgi:hypothetical protein
MWYEAFNGVCVSEPIDGPIDHEQVEKDIAEVWEILKAAQIKLDAEEVVKTKGRPKSEIWSIGLNTIPAEFVEMARKNKIPRTIVYNRIEEIGWSIETAFSIPVQKRERLNYTHRDVQQAEHNGIGRCTFISRIFRGWELERAKTQLPIKKRERLNA